MAFFKLLILESTRGHLSNHPVVIVKGADVDYDFNHGNEKRDRPVSDVAQVKANKIAKPIILAVPVA